LALAGATVALTTGCSAGLKTQTDQTVPAVPGANVQVSASPEGVVSMRNALIVYPGLEGYRQGATVPLELRLFNDTTKAIRLIDVRTLAGTVVLSRGAAAPQPSPSVPASPTAGPTGSPGASPTGEPSPSASPSPAPAGGPVNVEIPAGGFVVLAPGEAQFLQITGLTAPVPAAGSVSMTFVFSNNLQLSEVRVPIAPPESPEPRASSLIGGVHE
jgi:hypothetical protein